MSADAGDLGQRVTVLEGLVRRVAAEMGIPADMPMTREQEAEFRRLFETAAADFGHKPLRVLPSPPDLLDPDTVRTLLRESVTVVKPGEVLFFTAGDPNWTPMQIREIQDVVSGWLECNAPEVRVLVLPYGEIAVAEPAQG